MTLKTLNGVGPKTIEYLTKANVHDLNDLLLLEPVKYINYELSKDITSLKSLYFIENVRIAKVNKLAKNICQIIFLAELNNKTYRFIIFNKDYILYSLKKSLYVYASYQREKNYFLVDKIFQTKPLDIKVIYNIKGISDSNLSKIIYNAFNYFKAPPERLPLAIIDKYKFISYSDYLIKMHFPKDEEDLKQVLRRKTYEKYFWRSFFYEILNLKNQRQKEPKEFNKEEIKELIKKLPFELTLDQKEVLNEVLSELNSTKRINRLIEGDVGSGKTIVALLIAYATLISGYQAVFLTPTVILANQHYKNALKYFSQVYLLTSHTKTKERNEIIAKLNKGENILVIGTHSLLNIDFPKLGLVLVDEQQRFGVFQRSILQKKQPNCDTIYFTATPIPRSLAMTSYGGLDLSLIKTKPANRGKITTRVLNLLDLKPCFAKCLEKIAKGEQIFIVVPLIQSLDSNLFDLEKAKDLFASQIKAKYGFIHGKLKEQDKVEIIRKFNAKEIDVLIATTVIEVGVDIRNASVMIIMDADRYGLASLHQLRGRVGRSDLDSYVYLISDIESNERLALLEKIDDGFTLAEYDLKLRGPGDFLRNQSGFYNDVNTELEKKIFQYANYDGSNFAKKVFAAKTENKYDHILEMIAKYDYENN